MQSDSWDAAAKASARQLVPPTQAPKKDSFFSAVEVEGGQG